MNVLLGCEESQAVCVEFRKRGYNAYSCDIQPCSGGHPEWHIQTDIFEVINGGWFVTEAGTSVLIEKWDLGIFFPPCTYLTVTGARWMYNKDGSLNEDRKRKQEQGLDFVKKIMNCNIEKIAIENPVGAISRNIRQPDQIIQPYYFGDEAQKTTCLWLKNLPKLIHVKHDDLFSNSTHVSPGEMITTSTGKTFSKWYWETSRGVGSDRSKLRSKTFPGIAKAMAEQWG